MSTFEEQHITPQHYNADNVPAWDPSYDNASVEYVQLSPTAYTSILIAIVSLYIICSGIITYLVWDRLVRRKAQRLQSKANHDPEKGRNKEEETYTPATVVGTDVHRSPQFETVHLSPASPRSQGSPGNKDYNFPLPPKVTQDPGSPLTISSMSPSQGSHCSMEAPGLSIGDRLRSHLMEREITGVVPRAADMIVGATLGVNLNGSHSRSSLFTIPEVSAEASPQNSPDIIPSARGLMTNSSRTASSC